MNYQLCILPLIFIVIPSYGGMHIGDFSTGSNSVSFNTWSGAGNAIVDVDFCITSVLGRTRASNITAPYEIKLRARGGGGGASTPFQLDATSGNGQSLPITVNYTDLLTSSSEQLASNIYTAQDKQGAAFQCPSGVNARFRFTINQNDLSAAAAGNYRSLLRIVARGGDNGTERKNKNITVNISIDDIVQLQGIDDLTLGNYSGGDILATEAFCIYRNGSDAYQVTASGSGSGGSFSLLNNSTTIPYSVEWDDGSVASPMIANSLLTQRQNAVTDINSCNAGTSNARINIALQEQDLNASPSGNYRGTLTLIVAPE